MERKPRTLLSESIIAPKQRSICVEALDGECPYAPAADFGAIAVYVGAGFKDDCRQVALGRNL